jgi:hypothetical protein
MQHRLRRLTPHHTAVTLLLMLIMVNITMAQNTPGSNKQPLVFGADQTIIALNKLVWEPLTIEGTPPGPEIAVLRGRGCQSWCPQSRGATASELYVSQS